MGIATLNPSYLAAAGVGVGIGRGGAEVTLAGQVADGV